VYPTILGNNFQTSMSTKWMCKQHFLWPFHEIIYKAQLEDYVDPKYKNKVCKLFKICIYGLKQASRMWYKHFSTYFIDIIFYRRVVDSNIYVKKNTTKKCDFLEGPTWLKCSHWPRGMVILAKGLEHERHELLLTETFD
jgi:hypothetical protein